MDPFAQNIHISVIFHEYRMGVETTGYDHPLPKYMDFVPLSVT